MNCQFLSERLPISMPLRSAKNLSLQESVPFKVVLPYFKTSLISVKNFRQNTTGTGIYLAPKTGTGLSCTIYKIPVNFSLSLDMKPGTGNPNKRYRKFRSFR